MGKRSSEVQEEDVRHTLKTNILRVLQEGSNKVAEHREADRLCVAFRKKDGAVEIVVEDCRRRLDPRSAPSVENSESGFGNTRRYGRRGRTEVNCER